LIQILKVLLADSLVDGPFSGEPVTAVYLGEPLERFKMASLAAEFGTPETVYIYPHAKSFLLRFFTPLMELKAGINASQAAAHIIFELGIRPPSESLSLLTQEGEITASHGEGGDISMEMDAAPFLPLDPKLLDGYAALLGVAPGLAVWGLLTTGDVAVLAVEDRETLKRLVPDVPGLLKADVSGVAVTALSRQTGDCDYYLRSFKPKQGQTEEAVSGSVNRCLAPRWASLLKKKTVAARQLSRRGGLVIVDIGDNGRITLKGRARIILRSDINLGSVTGPSPV
jgi:PhzF family phenazine biosynthesis protein